MKCPADARDRRADPPASRGTSWPTASLLGRNTVPAPRPEHHDEQHGRAEGPAAATPNVPAMLTRLAARPALPASSARRRATGGTARATGSVARVAGGPDVMNALDEACPGRACPGRARIPGWPVP